MLFLLRVLRVRGPGVLVGALVFMLCPYVLTVAARLSVLLMPWAGLPWMLGLTVLALRRGGWRYPALFALVVVVIGGVNATALLFAGLAPALWFPFAVWVEREVSARVALVTAAKIGALTLLTSLWWIAGLSIQAGYGLNVLEYSETMKAVSQTSLSSEALRGLGYWFFYGGDNIGPWIESSIPYSQNLGLLLVSFTLPACAFLAAVVTRWRHRAYFVALIFFGTVIAVGAYPYDRPSLWGGLVKRAANESTAVFAMRSSGRVVPLIALGTSVLVAAGVNALARTRPRRAAWVAAALCVLAVLNLPALYTGKFVGDNLKRPEHVPSYWQQAASWLEARGDRTRVLELPGADFASYRWGNTVEPITPGLLDRPYAARELIPYGTPPSADLVNALDRRLQEGVFEPEALAPVARLMGVGDIVVRSDLQFERYDLARPRPTWRLLDPPPAGLGPPVGFGAPFRNQPERPAIDERALSEPAGEPDPPPVAVLPVQGARPIVRSYAGARPVLLAGDGEGIVDAATVGLLDRPRPVLYSAGLAGDGAGMRRALAAGADLVLTDTNRRRARQWKTVHDNTGYTEQAGEEQLADDPFDARLPLFPDAGDDAFTVAEQRGVRRVQATHYGNSLFYTPEDRPVHAFDGERSTAWRASGFDNPRGERLEIELRAPVTTRRVRLLQPVTGDRNRWITEATLFFDGGDPQAVRLGLASRRGSGESIDIGRRTFRTLSIRIDDVTYSPRNIYSPVGFAEVSLGGVNARADEVIRLPRDLLDAAGRASIGHRLDILLARQRADGFPPRTDEEPTMARAFRLPAGRAFGLTGTARVSLGRDDAQVDALLGRPDAAVTRSSSRMQGDLGTRASAAFDGDPATAWMPGFSGDPIPWVEADVPAPVTVDRLDLTVVADGRHSLPSRLRVETENGAVGVRVPAIRERAREGATVTVTLPLRRTLTGRSVRISVERVDERRGRDYVSNSDDVLPVGIAEAGVPGVRLAAPPAQLDLGCRDDLLTIDGRPVAVRVRGDAATAEARGALGVELCGADARGVDLGRGDHLVRAADGRTTGIDLDRLVLSSAAGGRALAGSRAGRVAEPAPPPAPAPAVTVERRGRTGATLRVDAPREPFWLVLGESHSAGWHASVDGRSLGPPAIVDGLANGWLVPADTAGRDVEVTLTWTPQRRVWVLLALSVLGVLLCLGLAVRSPGRAPAGATVAQPALEPVWRHRGRRPGRGAITVVTAGLLVVVSLVAGPQTGVLAAAVALAALVRSRARPLLTVGAVVAIAGVVVYTVAFQAVRSYPAVSEWPGYFRVSHNLAWLAIALLLADVVVGLARERASATGRG
jgi:hypothetical protein